MKRNSIPLYFFGVSKRAVEKYDCVMDNIIEYMTPSGNIKEGEIHRNYTAKTMFCDSGGFQTIDKKAFFTRDNVIDIQEKLKPDYVASLDYPIRDTMTIREIEKRVNLTLENIMYWDNNTNLNTVPVIHGYEWKGVKRSIRYINKYFSPEMVAIGYMIQKEDILNRKTKGRDNKFSERGISIKNMDKLLKTIKLIKNEIENVKIHLFGAGSTPAGLHILTYAGVSSVDSMGYRQSAGFGKIFIKGKGERHVSTKQLKTFRCPKIKKYELIELAKCNCDVCNQAYPKGAFRVELLKNNWKNRTIHNMYVMSFERDLAEKYLKKGDRDYAHFIRQRLKKSPLKKVFDFVVKRKRELKMN